MAKTVKSAESATTKADRWADKQIKGTNAPILSGIADAQRNQVTGGVRATTALAQGDLKGFAKGTGQFASGIGQSLTGGIFNMNKSPDPTYIGGSAEALEARRQQQEQGIAQGQAYTMGGMGLSSGGAGMIGSAYNQAGADRMAAQGMAIGGQQLGQAGIGNQNQAIAGMLGTAAQRGPSAAEAQMRMGLDQTQQAMMAQAASARGGNAAAAMRTAQAGGAQMAGQVNQQAAMLRAQEEANQRAQLIGAQQSAAGMYGQQAGLGYGMQGQGLGLAQSSTGQQGQFGANVGSIGLGQAGVGNQMQGNYLGSQTMMDKAQLEADTQQSSAKQGAKGGIMGVAGKVIGSIFGG